MILRWLQREPDVTAKTLFQRLQCERPEHYSDGQLRTLQRRLKQWRHLMARQLVHDVLAEASSEVAPVSPPP